MLRLICSFLLMVSLFLTPVAQAFLFSNPIIDQTAPDFTLMTTQDREVSFYDYRDGNRAILFFWATWCPHCRSALRGMRDDIATFEELGVTVVLVDIGEESAEVQAYLDQIGLTDREVFLDQTTEVSEIYQVQGVPTFVFVDKAGLIKDVSHSLPGEIDVIWR